MKLHAKDCYVLLCDSNEKKDQPLVCGVFRSHKEARELKKEIKDCPARHIIKKCSVDITLNAAPNKV